MKVDAGPGAMQTIALPEAMILVDVQQQEWGSQLAKQLDATLSTASPYFILLVLSMANDPDTISYLQYSARDLPVSNTGVQS